MSLNSSQVIEIASQIAKSSCTEGDEKLEHLISTFSKLGFDTTYSVQKTLSLVTFDLEEIKGYTSALKTLFLKKFLDLDINSTIALTDQLLKNQAFKNKKSNPLKSVSDLTSDCLDKNKWGLYPMACRDILDQIIPHLSKFQKPFYPIFNTILNDLKDENIFGLNLSEALKISIQLVSSGVHSSDDLKKSYMYLIKEWKLSPSEAFKIALNNVIQSSLNEIHKENQKTNESNKP